MKLLFDSHQEHQLEAIEAATDLFAGQKPLTVDLEFSPYGGFATVANRLDLSEAELLENLKSVQARSGLSPDDSLAQIAVGSTQEQGTPPVSFANFSVEMETGTGKTYAYVRTALNLYERYGFRKFVVVVPSVAIREGVLKTFAMTNEHLRELYGNLPYRYYPYNSSNLTQVRHFALSDTVEFMVMTLASFNKALRDNKVSNIIYRPNDRLQGETPIELIRATRPILILDEPQNMESEKSIAALSALSPLAALRYSATHRNPYNLIYRLTPYEAYQRGLVKRVEIAGVQEADPSKPFLRLASIETGKRTIKARVRAHCLLADGSQKERLLSLAQGDSLRDSSRNPVYAGYDVTEIDARYGRVRFGNGEELVEGKALGMDKEHLFRAQLRYTIEEHLRKQVKLDEEGIKVLSLVFIDRVDNYVGYDSLIRRLFREIFDELKTEYPRWSELGADDVQAAYFASRRTRRGETVLEDSKSGETQKDKEAYDLIMRDKETLLSLVSESDSPELTKKKQVAFIFSHSALREGWDNPNVFQICTLNESVSEVRKRQEIGRGVRLAVGADGLRVHDQNINLLTVVANDSYERYVSEYQQELDDEFAEVNGAPPVPTNARKRKASRLRDSVLSDPAFLELWSRIKPKTRYRVVLDADCLVNDVVDELTSATIRHPHIVIDTAELTVDKTGTKFEPTLGRTVSERMPSQQGHIPDVAVLVLELLGQASPPTVITRSTVVRIFGQLPREKQEQALTNPYEFATIAASSIRRHLADQLVDGIQYSKTGDEWSLSNLVREIERPEDMLVPAEKSLYDLVPVDSNVERELVNDLEHWKQVRLFGKLPEWFTVETPIGLYNPDWAIVVETATDEGTAANDLNLYLVRETKATTDPDKLRPDEARKISCARKHFTAELAIDYDVITGIEDLKEHVRNEVERRSDA